MEMRTGQSRHHHMVDRINHILREDTVVPNIRDTFVLNKIDGYSAE